MKSFARLAAVTAALLVVSLAPKVAITDEEGRRGPPARPAPEILGEFLVNAGAEAMTSMPGKVGAKGWTSWRFVIGGCETRAYPLPPGGEADDILRRTAGPGKAVRFIYRGRVSERSPRIAASVARFMERSAYRLGLRNEPKTFYVAIVHDVGCDAALKLPWRSL